MSARRSVALILVLLLSGAGCQSPDKQALEPLPANSPRLAYADLVERARQQLWAAQEIFYRDQWAELAKAAETMSQTGQQLAQSPADQVPPRCRPLWPKPAEEFRSAAEQLQQHARQRDAALAASDFQRLHLALKQIRPD